ncbi:MAG: hypothetical protein H0T91_04520 [Propionibacteriaceae bacterium]|nr:hypothetical protein [Propionibacteriaceae bacterium]
MAEHANIWHGFGDPETLAHKNEVLDDWCRRLGRDASEIERSCAAETGPEEVGEALLDVGTRLITLSTDGREKYDLGLVRAWLQFRDEQNSARGAS